MAKKDNELDTVHPDQKGFKERITAKPTDDSVFLFACTCGHKHFRHAGYMQVMAPFMRPGGEKRMAMESQQVMVCVSCKKSFVWINEQMYDVTDQVDLEAWEKLEKEAQKATGPGGEC